MQMMTQEDILLSIILELRDAVRLAREKAGTSTDDVTSAYYMGYSDAFEKALVLLRLFGDDS